MATTQWNLDAAHSSISFKVKHMMISTVTGYFTDFTASASSEGDDFTKGEFSFDAKVESITTANTQRDEHLKSGDFFDMGTFPNVSFKSTSVKAIGDDYDVTGDLTIKGITKPITLKAEFGGTGKDPWGNTKAGFVINAKFNRTDFGLNWNAALEAGGVLVSEEVKVYGEIQFVKA